MTWKILVVIAHLFALTLQGSRSPPEALRTQVRTSHTTHNPNDHSLAYNSLMVQCLPFQPLSQTQEPLAQKPWVWQRWSHCSWSHRAPVHPESHTHLWLRQWPCTHSSRHTSAGGHSTCNTSSVRGTRRLVRILPYAMNETVFYNLASLWNVRA